MATVKCIACGGSGVIELTGVYAETLALLRNSGEMSGAALARIAGIKPTAMSNRLAVLAKHGLARSRPYGRQRLYKAI